MSLTARLQTLLAKEMTALVEPGRQIKAGSDPINKLGKSMRLHSKRDNSVEN